MTATRTTGAYFASGDSQTNVSQVITSGTMTMAMLTRIRVVMLITKPVYHQPPERTLLWEPGPLYLRVPLGRSFAGAR